MMEDSRILNIVIPEIKKELLVMKNGFSRKIGDAFIRVTTHNRYFILGEGDKVKCFEDEEGVLFYFFKRFKDYGLLISLARDNGYYLFCKETGERISCDFGNGGKQIKFDVCYDDGDRVGVSSGHKWCHILKETKKPVIYTFEDGMQFSVFGRSEKIGHYRRIWVTDSATDSGAHCFSHKTGKEVHPK